MSTFDERFWQPWAQLERFHEDLSRLLSGSAQTTWSTAQAPALNIATGEEGACITALVPGVTSEHLEISVLGQTLTLRGSRDGVTVQEKEGEAYHRRERTLGEFSRTVELPFRVDAQKAVAEFNNGVLELTLPRAADDRPRRIAVKAS